MPVLTPSSNNARMPVDKYNQPSYGISSTASNPRLLNTLTGTAAKAAKSPLTPRIAPSTNPQASPNIRRVATPGIDTTSKQPLRDDLSTPVKAFLTSNVTPRSSSRKTRAGSNNSTPTATPNGTPTSSRPMSAVAAHSMNASAGGHLNRAGSITSGLSENNSLSSSFSLASPNVSEQEESGSSSSMFFYANEAKPVSGTTPQGPSRPKLQAKTSSFFYANGERNNSPPIEISSLARSPDGNQPFYFRANDNANGQTSPKGSNVKQPKQQLPERTVIAPKPTAFNPSLQNQNRSPRSPSPTKQSQPPIFSRRDTPPVASPSNHPTVKRATTFSNNVSTTTEQQQSTPTSPAKGASFELTSRSATHGRSVSLDSTDSPPSKRRTTLPPGLRDTPSPVTHRSDNVATTSGPLLDALVPHTPSDSGPPSATQVLRSPTVEDAPPVTITKLQHLDELAANARRERKVLDLEISNSSLLAINRSLERQMRKQHNELRRFQRLSRSGRLSLMSTVGTDSRKTSLSQLTEASSAASPSSSRTSSPFSSDPSSSEEDGAAFNNDDDDDDDDDLQINGAPLSPRSQAASDARHRAADERRLQLDLARHQELLVASQRMNQSLKRCLGYTEALIGEGQKALNYRVRVDDVPFGGRVLPHDDEEEEDDGAANAQVDDESAVLLPSGGTVEVTDSAAAAAAATPADRQQISDAGQLGGVSVSADP
ncbi:MAG: hypothetical protein M1825_005134 [Sarcosagium campestre]|nr:MAG: hypothetical protein M1825_005134 [Sarcosagium campestre]